MLLDIFKNRITNDLVQTKFYELAKLVRSLPYSKGLIKADLQDARYLPLENQSVSNVVPQKNNAERMDTHLGYVCAECKTNLDKTMFQKAVATSRDLKIALPSSLYFLVCEFLDMTPVSITSSHIDDVLIVRKTKNNYSSFSANALKTHINQLEQSNFFFLFKIIRNF